MTKVMVGCIENDLFFQPDSVYYAHRANYRGNTTLSNSIFGVNDDGYAFRSPTVEEAATLAHAVDRMLEQIDAHGFECCNEAEPNDYCSRCRNQIDPDMCHCGDTIKSHDYDTIETYTHPAIPAGCSCGYAGYHLLGGQWDKRMNGDPKKAWIPEYPSYYNSGSDFWNDE